MTGYVDAVASFQGRRWGGARVLAPDIKERALELVIPKGAGTSAQLNAIQSVVQYGRSVGVNVTVIPF